MKSMFEVGFRKTSFNMGAEDLTWDSFNPFSDSFTIEKIWDTGRDIYKGYSAQQKAEDERKKAEAQAAAARAAADAQARAGAAPSSPLIPGVSNTTLIIGGVGIVALALVFALAKG